jgi:outer membrane receptor protein involved in Fe transport
LNRFTIIVDNGSRIRFSGELTYSFGEELKLWLNGFYNNYSLDNLSQAYHEPLSMVGIGGSYLIKKKVNVWAEIYYYGKRYAFDNNTTNDIELDAFADINLGVDYLVNERLTIFVNGTNLLNQNYERFYNYPVQGIQVMAGVGFRF